MQDSPPIDAERRLHDIAGLIGSGRFGEAERAAAALRATAPALVEAIRLHAIALLQLSRAGEARSALADALAIAPRSVELLCNLGSVELALGDVAAALLALERAQSEAPAHPAVLIGLGNARRAAADLDGAAEAYAAATRARPDHPAAWLNLAAIELAEGRAADAERDARHALTLAPAQPEGWLLLGHVLAAQRKFAEARAAYESGASTAPRDARFPYQAALMAEEEKRLSDAAAAHARALELDPSLHQALGQLVFVKRQLCDWTGLEALSNELRRRVAAHAPGIAPFAFLSEPAGADEQLLCARTAAAGIEAAAAPLRTRLGFRHEAGASGDRLRVGFVSNGLGYHPTGLLIVAFIESLGREGVDAILFATAADDGSRIRRRLFDASREWHDVVDLPAHELARRLHAAKLDVLIDLRGYGGGGIAQTLALRPCALQVSWLAYPGTSGAPWIDYLIADRVVVPHVLRPHFSEALAWLPRCFQPSDTTRVVADPPSRAACGLPRDGPVFVSFNNSYKLNPASMARMFAVLGGVPDATLWLLSGPEGADDRLRAAAKARGLDPARLVFMPKLPHEDYLARYRHADLFLDTAPYNAHTTASDAIWAGCPVLTVPGATFAARVAASLNAHLGLAELNVANDDAFVATAIRLSRDEAFRTALRARLAERRDAAGGLFDMPAFAGDFAALLRRMAERRRQGLSPADLD